MNAAADIEEDGPARVKLPPRVLIVDDNLENCELLARRLRRERFDVVQVTSGRKALELIDPASFDLALVDVIMPDINGIEVLRTVRTRHSVTAFPMIMVTGRRESEDIVEALALGANDYVTKPIDFAVVLARINTQIGRKQAEEALQAAYAKLKQANAQLRENVEEIRQARDQAEAASAAKTQFLANMSHEIRTPLNGILGMAQIMMADELSLAQKERLAVLCRSGDSLLGLLNDVLDITRIESGAAVLNTSPFNLGVLMRDIHASLAPIALQKSLSFSVDVAPEADGMRLGDALKLRQVVTNLISNAVKFTEKGAISLLVKAETAGAVERISFKVADTGIGIAAEDFAHVFERFAQVDASNTRRFGGTGLGLAISAELVAAMGGQLALESEIDRGSAFSFSIPLPWAQQPSAPETLLPAIAPVSRAPAKARILAAEDNVTNRVVLGAIIDIFGFDCTFVEDGRQAIAAWAEGSFDLILMDVHMPHMDGLEATREIRTQELACGRGRIPVIALTASVLDHQVDECLAAGMDLHVAKPIDVTTLRGALDSMLNSQARQPCG